MSHGAQDEFSVLIAVANIERLSGSPVVLSKALNILRNPNSDASKLVTLITADPALTASILHLANSAFYGARRRVASLFQAVEILGYEEIYRLVGYHYSRGVLATPIAAYGLSAESFWNQSVVCALFMQWLAARLSLDVSEAYTVGLLHGIGRLAIDHGLRETNLVEKFRSDSLPFEERELKFTRLTFAEVGGMALDGWGFPEHLVVAVQRQTEPLRPKDPPLAAGLKLARHVLFNPPSESTDSATPPSEFLQAVGLSQESLTEARLLTQQRTESLRRYLGIR